LGLPVLTTLALIIDSALRTSKSVDDASAL